MTKSSEATEGFQLGEVKDVSKDVGNSLFQALTGLGFFGFVFDFFPLFFFFFALLTNAGQCHLDRGTSLARCAVLSSKTHGK